jgi:uncharacterized membrane protein (DUF106 family)
MLGLKKQLYFVFDYVIMTELIIDWKRTLDETRKRIHKDRHERMNKKLKEREEEEIRRLEQLYKEDKGELHNDG